MWKRVGTYGLEFAGSTVASAAGSVGAYVAGAALSRNGDVWYLPGVAVAYGGSALAGVFLSALGTHLVGRLFDRGSSYSHALAGGAIGGVAGSCALLAFGYSGQTGSPCWPLVPVGLALPAAGSVISYNVWRNHETK